MSDDLYITGTDIKNHIYCPRIIYFSKVMALEPLLYAQQIQARKEHKDEQHAMNKRKYPLPKIRGKVEYDIHLTSDKLKASAVIDCIIIDENRLIPVEFKIMKSKNGKAYSDHKYQLTFYALLLEELKEKRVTEGYINYLLDEKIIKVIISNNMKAYVKRLITIIRENILNERLPPITVSKRKCFGGCGYRHICYGF